MTVIAAESKNARGVETGGPLVGYALPDAILVVTNATGPGPRAKRERYGVLIDGRHAQDFCDRIHLESQGRIDYVGDWHKHPGISLRPSEQDALAMKAMAEFEFSPTKYPISLIYRAWPPDWRVYIWDGRSRLKTIESRIAPSDYVADFGFEPPF